MATPDEERTGDLDEPGGAGNGRRVVRPWRVTAWAAAGDRAGDDGECAGGGDDVATGR
ncbi:hypothetical protein [Actinopolyspora erythraea]|uniref:hypothetical protein n=1 Tax=Actinopolyspora erythraea TaxID=414996 RepID=UPI000A63CECD|nr:hypothetical protein [Actinopolyspora erythraea]